MHPCVSAMRLIAVFVASVFVASVFTAVLAASFRSAVVLMYIVGFAAWSFSPIGLIVRLVGGSTLLAWGSCTLGELVWLVESGFTKRRLVLLLFGLLLEPQLLHGIQYLRDI